jgi:hypothetical protein
LKLRVAFVFSALTLCLVAGCASNGRMASDGATPVAGTGIEMFGVIDAGVSHVTNKSAPVPPR